MATSILSRKRDIAYLIFFLIHIPIIFCVDITPLYPPSIKPQFMIDLRQWYITTYRDQFFVSPPAWFTLYMWMELFYHLPLSVWALSALLRDDPKVPVHLLAYAVQTAITTATCIADYLSWSGFSNAEKIELGKLYVPYLALSVFMGVDMYGRLGATLSRKASSGSKKSN
ncbi:Sigma intracellular receptor 2 [Fulvia fulva]|uniref:Efficient mitochondria targeting-associated protein 19 n=1 Tax=Passalora fulva TaxID=5499 RepID=A0A9Q8LDB2_PASFU|nr:Sigma intracellular receptor 2 [Fulvia fulva]KAK4629432.1 Sigma intracellular receptor 2 [Fulvia fulva]KAK4630620.1 Sigma intracellular receptor 2 [Fulvia fulva]UJO15395.1 Sigma intracellular receptor 2 [Fulvia fulva]WPV12372.1 Sigma intracellular receptor 2 [Fulvia fulva]WPV27166.1 Sigma intracellular receptor 2 [Fulvia fulva]